MEFGTIENLHLLIIAELKLYKPYAVLNTVKFTFFPIQTCSLQSTHCALKTFSTSNFSQYVTLFLVPRTYLEKLRYGTWTLELLKIFTCGLPNLYAKHGEIIKISMFLFLL